MGFEAELWEEKQAEAEQLVAKTRALLTLLATTVATIAPRMNRMMQGFSRREQLDLARQIEAILSEAGVDEAQRAALYGEIDRWTAFDLAIPITRAFSNEVHSRASQERDAIAKEFGNPIKDAAGFGAAQDRVREITRHGFDPNTLFAFPLSEWPQEIRRRIEAAPIDSEKKRALVERFDENIRDLESWVSGRHVRRPEVFFADQPE